MRLLLIILVLANLLALTRILLMHEPAGPVVHEYHADRIRLVPPPVATNAPTPTNAMQLAVAASTAAQAAHQPASTHAAPSLNANSPDKTEKPSVCLNWGPVPANQTTEAQTRLNAMQLGERLVLHDDPSAHGPYWIFYPPLNSKTEADDKLAQLQKSGIHDISIIRNGPWQNALSLGVFATAEAANNRLHQLNQQGLHAQIEAHGSSRSYTFVHLTTKEQASVMQLAQTLGLPAVQVIDCPGTE